MAMGLRGLYGMDVNGKIGAQCIYYLARSLGTRCLWTAGLTNPQYSS